MTTCDLKFQRISVFIIVILSSFISAYASPSDVLLKAASRGNIDMIKILEDNGASLLKPRIDGVTILHIGACANDLPLL